MKKLIVLALLAASSASFADPGSETVTVTGPRITPGSSPSPYPGGGAGPAPKENPKRFGDGEEGGSGKGGLFKKELTNGEVLVLVLEQFKDLVASMSQTQAWVEMDVTVTTKAGTKVDVHFRAGYGKTEVVSKSKPH